MRIARVIGKVWATAKDPKLEGYRLLVIQTLDKRLEPAGRPTVAVDTVSAGMDELVYWVGGGEGRYVASRTHVPSECLIVGLVDRANLYRDPGPRREGK
ncbi:MAG: EutN/CcmL family microcompartment protein [Candidatus Glassbacteria bacterium]|nr:EutN/CcmL family microcompartment protein [Candidatus Glassbacteria bacterium]